MDKVKVIMIIIGVLVLIAFIFYERFKKSISYLPITGGTMEGSIELFKLTLMGPPTDDIHLVNKRYVDSVTTSSRDKYNEEADTLLKDVSFDKYLPLAGGTLTGDVKTNYIFNVNTPSEDTNVVNKNYLDFKELEKKDHALDTITKLMDSITLLPLTGGVMEGTIVIDKGVAVEVNDPLLDDNLTNKVYLDKLNQKTKTTLTKDVEDSTTLVDIEALKREAKFLPLAGGTVTGNVVSNATITSNPKGVNDGTNKRYVDGIVQTITQNTDDRIKDIEQALQDKYADDYAKYLAIKGGTMKGSIIVPNITTPGPLKDVSLVNVASLNQAFESKKEYLDNSIETSDKNLEIFLNQNINDQLRNNGLFLPVTGGTLTGITDAPTIILNDPTTAANIANKQYVDSQAANNLTYLDTIISDAKDDINNNIEGSKDPTSYLPLAGGTLNGNLTVTAIETIPPKEGTDIATKAYSDSTLSLGTLFNSYPLTGGELKGSLDMVNNQLTITDLPVKETELANKLYVQSTLSENGFMVFEGGTMKGDLKALEITLNSNGRDPNHVVNLSQLDRAYYYKLFEIPGTGNPYSIKASKVNVCTVPSTTFNMFSELYGNAQRCFLLYHNHAQYGISAPTIDAFTWLIRYKLKTSIDCNFSSYAYKTHDPVNFDQYYTGTPIIKVKGGNDTQGELILRTNRLKILCDTIGGNLADYNTTTGCTATELWTGPGDKVVRQNEYIKNYGIKYDANLVIYYSYFYAHKLSY